MKLLSWNVNGFRAVQKKGLESILDLLDCEIVCLQEIKAMPDQIDLSEELYPFLYINSAQRKGYSGTLIASRQPALRSACGIGNPEFDQEGRVLTCWFEHFTLVNVYTPNSQQGLRRLEFRQAWDRAFWQYVSSLEGPVVICGDFNVARGPLDLWDEADGKNSAGYSKEERAGFENGLQGHFEDLFRILYPEKRVYSWWSYYSRGRERNHGWRIDYWLASPDLVRAVRDVKILNDVYGSDHCPVLLDIDLSF